MHVISRKAITDFAKEKRVDFAPFGAWFKIIDKGSFPSFASLKKAFNSVDVVGHFHVFDISGNKYRIVAAIHFDTQKLYIRKVFTHAEYEKWTP